MHNKDFAKRLKLLRKQRGLIQTKAADLIGLSYKALQDHEGGRMPNQNNINKYVAFYGCNKNWLLTGLGRPFNNVVSHTTKEDNGLWGKTRRMRGEGEKEFLIESPPTHQELADIVGASRQTVTNALLDLRDKQCVRVDEQGNFRISRSCGECLWQGCYKAIF